MVTESALAPVLIGARKNQQPHFLLLENFLYISRAFLIFEEKLEKILKFFSRYFHLNSYYCTLTNQQKSLIFDKIIKFKDWKTWFNFSRLFRCCVEHEECKQLSAL